ncbi:MAG: autotransporter-associated N-terminal domain-containing protein [Fusobacterium sp.]|nr:autotransporter-associated N-terminal domain-containing protein [Fusobacterium sp.]
MKSNTLRDVENSLRSIAKRYKSVNFSTGLAVAFLMLGVNAFSQDNVQTKKVVKVAKAKAKVADDDILVLKEYNNLKISKSRLKELRAKVAKARLEQIKLKEQGNQVVKSPWASWQFGMNYMYDDNNKAYEGRGDKKEKYYHNDAFKRPESAEERGGKKHYTEPPKDEPITPGKEDTKKNWEKRKVEKKAKKEDPKKLEGTSRSENKNWGLVVYRDAKEPINTIE